MAKRVPMVLRHCGCTVCSFCVKDIIDEKKATGRRTKSGKGNSRIKTLEKGPVCPVCGEVVLENDLGECRRN
jgi:hypothetical protein